MFSNKPYDYIDIAFPIVHGTNVEDGALQGFLQYFGVPVVGSDVLASAVGMDKYSDESAFERRRHTCAGWTAH